MTLNRPAPFQGSCIHVGRRCALGQGQRPHHRDPFQDRRRYPGRHCRHHTSRHGRAFRSSHSGAGWAWPRTARTLTRSNARAAGSRAAAWSAATPATSPPGRRCGTCTPFSFALITAVHHCPTVSVQGNTIDRNTDDDDLSQWSVLHGASRKPASAVCLPWAAPMTRPP